MSSLQSLSPVGQNKRAAQKAATRQALAEAAVRLFGDQGFDVTTVQHIAQEAGVTERTFFLHFPTKEAAAFPDHEVHIEAFREALASRPGEIDPLDHLHRLGVEGVRVKVASRIRRTRQQMLASIPALRDHDARMDRDYEAVLVDYLADCWGNSPEARLEAEAVANAALAVGRAAMDAWARDDIDPVSSTDRLLARLLTSFRKER